MPESDGHWLSLPPPPFVPTRTLDLDGDGQATPADLALDFRADEYGRLRVHDKDTGHALTIAAATLAAGNFAVLAEPASDACGDPLPPEHHRFPVEPITSGQEAENEENDHG